MPKTSKISSFFKGWAIFYVSLIVLGALFFIYYYYYIPRNQNEFNERGSRVLKKHIENLQKQSVELDTAFNIAARSKDVDSFKNKTEPYKRLYDNAKYNIDTPPQKLHTIIGGTHEYRVAYPVNKP